MKTVLVTGGTIRLGKAISERLRADGWRVLTSSHRADAGADIVADLTKPQGATELYAKALKLLGGNPPDAIVNNAALFIADEESIRKVNFEAPSKLITLMGGRETGIGSVVNILDCEALGTKDFAPGPKQFYLDVKRALKNETLLSASTFAGSLRVNAVAPGAVLAPTQVHERACEILIETRPTPADVAAAVAYLLSAESVTGVIIPVDAGAHLLVN